MQIKIFKSNKRLNKFLLKTIFKETSFNNYLTLGIGYENAMVPFFKLISDFKKIKWNNIKIISLIEYFDCQSTMFYSILQKEFISKLNGFNEDNFFNKIEDIKNLKESNNLNNLYDNKIDLGIFYLDFRGNFLLNDYESKCNFIHISTNGDKIVSPGLKSIFSFNKIIIIANSDNSERVLNKLASKEIDENEPFTFLNFHKNSILLTLSSLISKRDIVDSINNSDLEKWNKKIFKENQNVELDIDMNKTIGDKYINDNLSEISVASENSLDDELEEALKIIDQENVDIIENDDNKDLEIDLETETNISKNIDNQILDDSLLENLNDTFSNENHFDEELYGSNYGDQNLFSQNNLFESNKEVNEDDIKSTLIDDNISGSLINDNVIEKNTNNNIDIIPINEIKDVEISDSEITNSHKYNGVLELDKEIIEKTLIKDFKPFNFYSQRAKTLDEQKTLEHNLYSNTASVIKAVEHSNSNEINYLTKIIKIKEDALKSIEILQIKSNIDLDNKINKLFFKFEYIPGMRPTPMMAVYDIPNSEVYHNTYDLMVKGPEGINCDYKYINQFKHLWNHGAYIIFDEINLEIKSFLFTEFSMLIFLLRNINKKLWFYIPKDMEKIFKNELKTFVDEFLLIKK